MGSSGQRGGAFQELTEVDLLPAFEVNLPSYLHEVLNSAQLPRSWSPDGAFIAASNAMNGPVFVAAVIEREGWRADISFVGHANTIQVAVSLRYQLTGISDFARHLTLAFSFKRAISLHERLLHAC